MVITSLPQATVHLLKSGQVITSPWSVVKELVENSLDAGATTIEIRLEDFGFVKIEVRDNGTGVPKTEVPCMVQPHSTSKITKFTDLSFVESYGFRGEALSSLCSVSDLKILTKTKADLVSTTFSFDKTSVVTGCSSQAGRDGTTVIAANLFSNLPVRKNYYKDMSRRKEELKRIERLVQALAIINTRVRFSLFHNKNQIFGKLACEKLNQSFAAVIGQLSAGNMMEADLLLDPRSGEFFDLVTSPDQKELEASCVRARIICPKRAPGMSVELGRCSTDKTFVFVNQRPVEFRQLEKLLQQVFSQAAGLDPTAPKFPVCVVSLENCARGAGLDPNLEPNKQRVGLACAGTLLAGLERHLRAIYGLRSCEGSTGEGEDDALNDSYGRLLKQCEQAEQQEEINKLHAYQGQKCKQPAIRNENPPSHAHDGIEPHIVPENMVVDHGECPKVKISENPQLDHNGMGKENSRTAAEGGDVDAKEGQSRHSPVLKPEMFASPEKLPGRDALYIARLKDGDFCFEDEEGEEDDAELLKLTECDAPMPRHPFILYECEVEKEERSSLARPCGNDERSSSALSVDNIDVCPLGDERGLEFAKGTLIQQNGVAVAPVRLLQPGQSTVGQPPPKQSLAIDAKRKRKIDDLTPRIDAFLAKSSQKRLKTASREDATSPTGLLPKVTGAEVGFSLAKCREAARNRRPERRAEDALVGMVDKTNMGGWVFLQDAAIHLLSPLRVKESLIYNRLLASHPLSSQRLSEPIIIHPGHLSDVQLKTALSLYINNKQCPARITDRRITMNGFDLVLYQYGGHDASYTSAATTATCGTTTVSSTTIKMEGRCSEISYYGLADLLELLDRIGNCAEDSVAKTRPEKVRQFLSAEATRLGRDLPCRVDQEEARELVAQRTAAHLLSCLHGRPTALCLHELRSSSQ